MQEQDESAPAWLVTLGISDWEDEMRLLEGCERRGVRNEEDTC